MKRKLELVELKRIQLEIMDDVDHFCRANHLRYSLCGGTLLGAVRHQGYIPWDDDIDIMMPRSDYEWFIQSYHSDQNSVLDLRKVPTTVELCTKVCRNDTYMTDKLLGRTSWGINIDVFPIDGIPAEYDHSVQQIIDLRERLGQICPFYRIVPRHKILWFLKFCLKRILCFYPGDILSLKHRIHELSSRYHLDETPLGAVILGSYGKKEIIKKEVFSHFSETLFEGRKYVAITDFHSYLHALYGDYMQLPPEEKRTSHHQYDVFAD